MTEQRLLALTIDWDRAAPPDEPESPGARQVPASYVALHGQLLWFGSQVWAGYLPAQHQGCSPSYSARLASWIGNTDREEEQKLLLAYAGLITFFTHDDMTALFRSAFSGPITRWMIDHASLRFDQADFQLRLHRELHQRTWFCPVTDSMDINEFYHLNHLTGISHRPAFSPLAMLAEKAPPAMRAHIIDPLKRFMADPDSRTKAPPLVHLVLLEDFVGSGTQIEKEVEWVVTNLDVPVLFVPMVICPQGRERFEKLAKKHSGKLTFSPVLSLKERDLLGPRRQGASGFPDADKIEAFARASFTRVAGSPHARKKKAPYSPFGWEESGCSLVTFSNTPNNTLPLVHHRPANDGWQPLFPRAARV